MAKDSNVAIDQNTAVLTMAEIRSETEQFQAEMDSAYGELSGLFEKSEGEFITALKVQINAHQEMIHAACDFFQTLLDMMNAADTDFNKLDDNYAQEKIK